MVDGKEAKPRAAEDSHDDGSSDGGTRLQVFKQVSTVMVAMDRIAHMTAVLMVARVSRCSA